MSKINAVRLINLNYNNNAIRISDEIFHLNGESTLLSLRNGGGKSVLVQMMMAPFVHKRYRDAKDRPFESYFTTAKPTFILVEWVLDQGAGYVLTGMMVRKSQDMTEGSGENLEIVNVISEYKKRCMQDIYNLPVVEKTKKEVRLKGFGACRQLFETYKKDSSMKFFCYDMSNTAQSKQYFDRLREYQINYKEWETIIKKINLKESGLSDLFADCRDEKGLVEKWFLDAVESKLNKEKNRMREFQNIIQKYAGQYKDNKSKIERRDTIRQFREQAVRIEESIRSYENAGNEQRSCENRIAAFIAELKRLDDSIAQEIENLQTQIEELQRQIFHVEYEQISGDIHRLKREARNVESNRDMIDMERDGLQREYDRITHKLHVFSAAKQSGQVRIRQEEWQELEQKLEVSRRKQEELEPERNYLGYTLKMYYERELEKNRQREINNGSEQEKAKEQILDGNQRLRDIQEQMSKLHEDIGIYQGLLRNFSEKEDAFNHYYQENFVRNILGEYEPGMLDICRETYEKQQEQLSRNRIQYKRDLENCTERERSTKRAIEDGKRDLSELANERTLAQQRLSGYEAQLGERKNILRYLDIPEQDLFDRDKILMSCYRKLEELGAERRRLEQEEDVLQKEYVKLTQGKVLELTPEFEEMLKTLGLNYIYGMEWLQRNGRPAKENRALVKSHPFLPYALILSSGDLKKLETHAGDVYTSTPVPIVLREQLDRAGISESSPVLSFKNVNFYLLFNENLLDEEMLARLVAEKEAQIQKKRQAISVKTEEYNDYFSRQETVKKQDVTRESYDGLIRKIEEIGQRMQELEKQIEDLGAKLSEITERMELLREQIAKAQEQTNYYERRKEEFEAFCAAYEQYLENNGKLNICRKTMQKLEDSKKLTEDIVRKKQEHMSTLEKEAFQIQNVLRELQGEYQIYERYERSAYEAALETGVSLIGGTGESGRNVDTAGGEMPEISGRSAESERTEKTGRDVDTAGGEMPEMSGRSVNSAGGETPKISGKSANSERTEKTGRDVDTVGGENTGDFGEIAGVEVLVNSGEITRDELIQLKTRYQAITRQISGERQELERNLIRAKERYDSELDELKHLEQKFGLQESEYHDVFYDRKEESHQEVLQEECKRKIEIKQQQWHEENRKVSVLMHDLKNQVSDMQKRFQKEEPLPEAEILHTDFEAELNQLRFRQNETHQQMQSLERKQQSYQQNLTGLAEYELLQVKEEVVWEHDFSEMGTKQLRDFQGMLKRDYRQSEVQTKDAKTRLERLLNQISRIEAFQEDFFRKPLETLQELVDDAFLVKRQLATITQSYENLMQKLEVDISMVEKEKTRIVELLEEYVKEVHENLGKIDHNSTITIRERAVKMLRIKLPDWQENENLYQIRLQDFMDEITNKGIELFERNENAPEYFGTKVTTKNLYDSVIGIGNVQIGLYKIEEYREYPITWADVAKNSGGEGFLSAFVILSSLLYYMRKDDSDIFADRNEGKVLVMDNPFAQTNAAHLLKPLMDMAKKTNTQLICLSGLGGESIYNRFDNIYVLNLIAASLRNGMQYLKSEHLRGLEQETVVVSQVEVFEQQELIF